MAPGAAPTEKPSFAASDVPTTTTVSTIAVHAGLNSSIVVALLKSAGYMELRVDEMRPKLLAIGCSSQESSGLLQIHEDLMARLADKEDQVADFLSRTETLGSEKNNPNDAIVYDDMSRSMSEAWRSLNRQLILRLYLLREVLQFYKMAEFHEKLTADIWNHMRQLKATNAAQLAPKIDTLVNDLIDTTATAADLGNSVITQIRTLGQIDDNPERLQEILNSCVIVETVLLRVGTEWEKAEHTWQQARSQPMHATTTETDELTVIEQWLTYAEKRLKALNEAGQKQVLNEGNKHVARLRELTTTSEPSETGRISHLSGRIEEFIHYLKTRMNRSQRIHAFIQAAKPMLSQLNMMVADMRNASAAISNELAPLAHQKASPLISEGRDIAAKEVLNYEEQRLVRQLCEDLEQRLAEIDELAKQRVGSQQTNNEIFTVKAWLDGPATAFLAQRGDMGGSLNEAREFVAAHKQFATDVLNRDASVMSIHAKRAQMTPEDEKHLSDFVKNYEKMKDILENRIQLGTTYEQVHKFAKDLEASFDALQTLLENNQEFTNEKITAQIANVFQMIEETLTQEKHQGEKFISNATQMGKGDEWLNVRRAQDAVRNLITDHENRFKYVSLKWNEWQRNKTSETTVEREIEVIQMWQEDVLEYISRVDRAIASSKKESEETQHKLSAFRIAAEEHSARLESLKKETSNEEQLSRISVLVDRQDYIKTRLTDVFNKMELSSLLRVIEDVQIWQEEAIEIIRTVDQVASTKTVTDQQIEELRRRVRELSNETTKKSQKLQEARSLSQNASFQQQLQTTVSRQEQIQRAVEQLDQKLEVSNLVRVADEIQMWQEEMTEIVRLIDNTRPSTAKEAAEVVERIEELRQVVEQKTDKIIELKKMSSVPSFVEKVINIEERQKVIKNLVVELQKKFEELTLSKTVEEIQMWQEEMVEIIGMLDSTPMKGIEESRQLEEKVEMVKTAIELHQPRIDEVVAKARDEALRTQVAHVVQRQQHLRQMAEKLEQKARSVVVNLQYTQPEEIVAETKTVDLTTFEKSELYLSPEEKQELQQLKKIIEEVQIWQEETIEIIRLYQVPANTVKESEEKVERVEHLLQTVEHQSKRIEPARQFVKKDETFTQTVEDTVQRQNIVHQLVKELQQQTTSRREELTQQEASQRVVVPPKIGTQLRSAEVDEGARFEFNARVEGSPTPVITWLKDGIDVKSNIDYRQEFLNGVASLVIEESFIEDTATYTVRAVNEGGVAESSAQLIVKSRSAMSSTIPEEDKPRFVKQLQNVQVTEGETARLDCVVVGRPEPEVVWYKEDVTVKEDKRVRLQFAGDHCQMVIEETVPLDTGMYTAKAKNVHGEVANFCQLKVSPRKKAPPTAPKPISKPQMVMRPPTIQPPLTNTTWQSGDTAVLKVYTQGEPRPRVHWKFNDTPLQTSSQVSVTEKEDGWSTLTISRISPVHAGMYTAVAENECGEAVTGATVHVQPNIQTQQLETVTEEHLQEEMRENVGYPMETTTITKTSAEYQDQSREQAPFPQPRSPVAITEDKRWVEVIQEHFEEHMSQPSPILSPIPQVTERKRIESEQRWVDSIDEILGSRQPPTVEMREKKTIIGEEHFSSHKVHEPSPKPHAYNSTQTTTNVAHIGQSHEPVQPDIRHSTMTSESTKTMNVATIRESPQPEVHEARTTPGPTAERAATIRRTPVRETQQATLSKAPSLENVAKIRQSPVPETQFSTITRRSASVENIAKIQPASQPDVHTATTTGGLPIGNIAQIHVPNEPDRQAILKSAPRIDRIDDIVEIPPEEKVKKTIRTTTEVTTDVDKQQQEQARREQMTKISVTETTSGEGWIQQRHQDMTAPQTSTVTIKRLDVDEGHHISQQQQNLLSQTSVKKSTKEEEEEMMARQAEISAAARQPPKTTKTVTETTSGEGWIQQRHDDMSSLPHKSTVTVKRLDIEEEERLRVEAEQQYQQQLLLEKRSKEEELEEIRRESRIPIRREPKSTKTVTETVSGEGWIQHAHDDMTALPHTSTVTTKKLGIEEEAEMRSKQTAKSRPISTEIRRQTDDESSVKQRDSFIVASDQEGFWTDGAYTASPTPPPVPPHRMTAEENMQRIGLSRTTTEPQFIRSFQKEYTVEEGGRLLIECVLVGNPKPKTRFFFNDKLITEKNEFCKLTNVNDTYSILINPANLEHSGYYKIIAENKRGVTESLTMVHVRPKSLQQNKVKKEAKPLVLRNEPTEHTVVEEEFAMFEYEQRRPQTHERDHASKLATPPPAKRLLQKTHRSDDEHLEQYDIEGRKTTGHPPHFTQTLTSTVAGAGEGARFEGVVTGWPAPTVEWTVDGKPIDLPDVKISNIGGRVSFTFANCAPIHGGKYMCTAKNNSGVATSSAQLVVRPKTTAPDFIHRLISEEVEEGTQLKWTVKVTGDPMPNVTWLRDGYEIPDCDEVRLLDEGDGVYSLVIVRVESADSGQFTCLAENVAGEVYCGVQARSTADLVVRSSGAQPGNYFHITKVTQERQAKGAEPVRTSAFAIENPRQSEML